MKFNIKAHLKNHSDFFKSNREIYMSRDFRNNFYEEFEDELNIFNYSSTDKNEDEEIKNNNYLHFKLSFSIEDFKDKEEAQRKLFILLKELQKYTLVVEEKNGWRKRKDGSKVQKIRKRKIDIGEEIKMSAVHTSGFDNLWLVNPHIHFLFSKKARLGKNFSYLKQAITDIIKEKKLNITPSFSLKDKENNITKGFKKVLNARSWAVRKNNNINIKTLKKFENDVIKYLLATNNLEFVIKQYILLRTKFSNVFYPRELEEAIFSKFLNYTEDLKNKRETKLTKFVKKDAKYFYPGGNSLVLKYFELNEDNLNAKLFDFDKYYSPLIPGFRPKSESILKTSVRFILENEGINEGDIDEIIRIINSDLNEKERIEKIKNILRFKVINQGSEEYFAYLINQKAIFYNDIINKEFNKGRFDSNIKTLEEKINNDNLLKEAFGALEPLFKNKEGYKEFLYFLSKKIREDEYFSKSGLEDMFYDELGYLLKDKDLYEVEEVIKNIDRTIGIDRVVKRLNTRLDNMEEYKPLSDKEIEEIKERREIAQARRRNQNNQSNSRGFGM